MRKVMWVLLGCVAVAFAVKFGSAALWAQGEAKPATLMLFDFEDEDGLKKFDANKSETAGSAEHVTSGKQSLKVTLKTGENYPSIYTERFPTKDWSGYAALKFDVFVDEAITLSMTVKDVNSKDYASRYNRDKVELEKGANTVTVTLGDVGDAIDPKKIKSMTIFAGKVDKDTMFYLDNVRLEK